MVGTTKTVVVVMAALALCAASGRAAIITVELTAEVIGVSHPELLDGQVGVDDIITGTYSYDSETLDSNPSEEVGVYWQYTAPYGVSLTVGGFVFESDPDNVGFLIEVGNDHGLPSPDDHYLLRSYSNLPLSNGLLVDEISWVLQDYSGTALSSDALPLTAPVLEDWPDYSGLLLNLGERGAATVGARVTSVQLVPEPGTFLLLALGTLALRRRKRL